jgi:succinate dehydrogenase / fumarate reductase cytochrome b subunit
VAGFFVWLLANIVHISDERRLCVLSAARYNQPGQALERASFCPHTDLTVAPISGGFSPMATLVSTIQGALRYRGKEGQLAWVGHRLAGLGTLLFFVVHVIDTSFVYFWPSAYDHVILLYRSLPFQVGEILLLVAVIYHGFNGLRITLLDWKPRLWKYQRGFTLATFGLTALLSAPAVIIMGGHAIENLGLFQ